MSDSSPATTESGAPMNGRVTRREALGWRNAIFLIFFLSGIGLASWVSRVPAVRDELGASTSDMGVLLFGLAAGSILGLVASSHVLARVGARVTMVVCLVFGPLGFALAGVGASVGPSFWLIFAGLAVFGAGMGMCDVAMNVSGAANERIIGRTIMPLFHAAFSVGTMVGAALGALAEALSVPIVLHVAAVSLGMIVAVLICARFILHERLAGTEADEAAAATDDTWRNRLAIWRDPRTLLIGLVILGMAFAEGSANDWLALAMVDGHSVSNTMGALVFGIFVTAMTVGRIAGVFVLDRYGRVPVLRVSAAMATVGLLLVILVPNPVVAVVGVVLWGLGSSLGFPVGMSAAADDPATAGARVSAVATIGYCAFLVGPPLIGFLGEQVGLLNALLVVLVLVAVAGLASGAAREATGRRAPAAN
ncbi:MFS transporter [Planctomonas psychrotolerans]|uniref:MFS transporter n=1 Tax=Planctomonas psychrotolerans TaxID=2528712 RepID=UPI001D0D3A01|nr:MFS transporter [Planctomonas psychrotolerans]